ncbi:MAG: hypothetical protein HC767_01680 [Akkermansiaceae bacterium]|nr:hypothetical protein [Akkermansiaceae bacterium]
MNTCSARYLICRRKFSMACCQKWEGDPQEDEKTKECATCHQAVRMVARLTFPEDRLAEEKTDHQTARSRNLQPLNVNSPEGWSMIQTRSNTGR